MFSPFDSYSNIENLKEKYFVPKFQNFTKKR
jgi:hypothetical protein